MPTRKKIKGRARNKAAAAYDADAAATARSLPSTTSVAPPMSPFRFCPPLVVTGVSFPLPLDACIRFVSTMNATRPR
jgi:hypothetical protein